MTEDIFYKILTNTGTDAEKKDFFSQLENDKEKREEFYQYKNLFVVSNLKTHVYKEIQQRSFEKFWNTVQPRKTLLLKTWMKYAAIFITALVLGVTADKLLLGNKTQGATQHVEYASETGSVSTVFLEDGSEIWLSSGTKLVIDKNSQGESVAKLDGEAYFNLIPSSTRKFLVDFGQIKIKDIGTKFNIRAYTAEKNISTTLIKGKIDLTDAQGNSILAVHPGEIAQFDRTTNKVSVGTCDASIVTAWKEGKFVFIDEPLSDICKELEKWYNVEIRIEDQKLADTRYTSVVKRSTTVQMVLKILAVTDQIHYKITEKKIGKDIIEISK